MSKKRNTLSRLLSPVASVFPVGFYTAFTRQRILLPLYHLISDEDVKHVKHLYPVRSINQFKRDVEFFLKHFSPISYHDLIIGKAKKNSFHLTFDDGLRECHDVIAPILLEKGIPATFFINSAFLNNKDLMYRYKVSLIIDVMKSTDERQFTLSQSLQSAITLSQGLQSARREILDNRQIQNSNESDEDILLGLKHTDGKIIDEVGKILNIDFSEYLKKQQPYLTTLQTEYLLKKGFTIGAHSIDHPDYRLLSLEDQLKQTKESIDFISGKFNLNYRTFAFPFTDDKINRQFFDTVFDPANPIADSTFGGAGIKKDIHKNHFQRLPIEKTTHEASEIVKFEYLYYLMKAPFGKNRIRR